MKRRKWKRGGEGWGTKGSLRKLEGIWKRKTSWMWWKAGEEFGKGVERSRRWGFEEI